LFLEKLTLQIVINISNQHLRRIRLTAAIKEHRMSDQSSQKEHVVKKTNCPTCGAPKRLPSEHAHIYCDFCGSYTDYDFSKVFKSAQNMYTPEYLAKWQSLYTEKEKAKTAGNIDKYYDLELETYAMYMDLSPKAWPVRIGDPYYKKDMLIYTARYSAFSTFDEELTELLTKAGEVNSKIESTFTNGILKYSAEGSWNYYLAWYEHTAMSMLKWERSELSIKHPDRTDPRILIRNTISAFLQGISVQLPDSTREKILVHSGLVNDYIPTEKKDATQKICGHCGAPLTAFSDSTQKVCEYCGYIVDVGSSDFNCTGCGMGLSVPVTDEELKCPSCSTKFKIAGAKRAEVAFKGNCEDILCEMVEDIHKEK
jgi:DNA-directed RNA polymerase subunit RPC12/RpoP